MAKKKTLFQKIMITFLMISMLLFLIGPIAGGLF